MTRCSGAVPKTAATSPDRLGQNGSEDEDEEEKEEDEEDEQEESRVPKHCPEFHAAECSGILNPQAGP